MTYSLRFRPEVVNDLKDAASWYEDRKVGLGAEFLQQCKATLDRISKRPEQATVELDGIRSVRIHRFPYIVHFRVERSTLVVFAIMFGGRDASAWRSRV